MAVVVPVTFRFPARLAPAARNVSVVGSFNGWDPAAHPMRRAEDGGWAITVYLPPARVVYTFSVDGVMWLDPEDEGRLPNGWGSEYSVRHVAANSVALRVEAPARARPEAASRSVFERKPEQARHGPRSLAVVGTRRLHGRAPR
jgi:1,4-alpha-glucan branching enzyme